MLRYLDQLGDFLSVPNPTSMQRIKLLFFSLVIAGIMATSLECLLESANCCQLQPISGAFSFVFPFMGHVAFPLFYFIGLLVSWYQVSGGLNCWLDLGEGIAIAGFGYAIAEAIVFRQKKAINRIDERARKAAHIISNLSACLLIWFLGIQTTSYFVLLGTCIGIFLMHLKIIGIKIPGIDGWLRNVGREGEIPGEGALYNALGILFALSVLRNNYAAAISVVLILALGDGFATYIGTRYGKHKLPWNKNKTFEGSIGFAAGAICALFVMPIPATIPVVMSATIIESLPLRVNDNIVLPVISSLLYLIIV
ncbi:MAG: Cytidylyltransferase family protein [Euryarchaeota archaeon]|nr:Cytidylyltransferase family protein [Euryarchaeota archaeon]